MKQYFAWFGREETDKNNNLRHHPEILFRAFPYITYTRFTLQAGRLIPSLIREKLATPVYHRTTGKDRQPPGA